MKTTTSLLCLGLCGWASLAAAQSSLQGLWVGEARLTYATEVTVPLDEDNIPRAPDPTRPTKTFDAANIRLILHVDGIGQVHLLKEVAVLKRTDGILAAESDMSLVTDPRLFSGFPVQPAQRIASVVFDFGDQKATDAIQAVMDAAVDAAADWINTVVANQGPLRDMTEAEQAQVLSEATNAAQNAAQAVVDLADAEVLFDSFLTTHLSSAQVEAIATAGDPASAAQVARAEAVALRDNPDSFYRDGRAVAMVDAIVSAVESIDDAGGTLTPEQVEAARIAAAQNTAGVFADVDDEINRFLAGKIFGDLIEPVATVAAELGALRVIAGFSGAAGSEPVEVASADHGLNTNDQVVISEAAIGAYNGTHEVTRVSEDAFTIPVNYVAGGAITSYGGAPGTAPLEVTSVGHGLANGDRIVISDAGVVAYNGEFFVEVTSDDTFLVDVTVEPQTGGLGRWAPAPGGAWKFTKAAIQSAAESVAEENAAHAEAISIQSRLPYPDTRGTEGVTTVVNAMVEEAFASSAVSRSGLAEILAEVGRDALASDVVRYPLADSSGVRPNPREMAPTPDFNDFVRAENTELSDNFQTSAPLVAAAAAQGAFDESRDNPLSTERSVRLQALVKAANDRDVQTVFAAAARANRTELPMEGAFSPGSGDARFLAALSPGDDLGAAGLTGVVVLPAMHPTNPFRHRRHPDHTVGFDIVRKIRLDFDGTPGDPLDRAGFGVDRVTGIYREEVTKPDTKVQGGLHKPLGPNQDRGLMVEGTFELNRISLIDTLNAK